ncbi:MAG: hypothetical protein IJR57_02595 [Ruminococcus sp.]|nr:hypothetical protein [Ruminococcus sp.]
MREKKTAVRVMIFALVLMIFFSALSFSAAAAPDSGGGDQAITDGGEAPDTGADAGAGESVTPGGETPQDGAQSIEDGNVGEEQVSNPDDQGDGQYETPTAAPENPWQQYEPQNEYINRIDDLDDNISQYTPNENLAELPTVAPAEVVAATAEPLPDVEVSDASLFSGIVMWLCVAVGISVVAGVMVSKRTHRRGA